MGAAFISGAAFSAVSGMSSMGGGGANAVQSAFSTGVLFALLQGAIYKVKDVSRFSQSRAANFRL